MPHENKKYRQTVHKKYIFILQDGVLTANTKICDKKYGQTVQNKYKKYRYNILQDGELMANRSSPVP